jgi:hypothetical protein
MFHNVSNSKLDITNDHDQVHDFFGGKFLPFCNFLILAKEYSISNSIYFGKKSKIATIA